MGEPASPSPGSAPPAVRVVLLGWCLWLLGSWGVTLTISSTVPATRGMVMMSLLGVMAIWPAVRLSQPTTWRGAPGLTASEALLEWVCLMLVFQAVIWPLRLSGGWPMVQAWSLNAAVAGWSLVSAWLVGWGRASDHAGRRWLAMSACLAVLVAEPVVLALLAGRGTWSMVISPLETVWRLTSPAGEAGAVDPGRWAWHGVIVLALGVAAWLGMALVRRAAAALRG